MVRHNNQIPNQHFRKNWAVRAIFWVCCKGSKCCSAQRRSVHGSRLRVLNAWA